MAKHVIQYISGYITDSDGRKTPVKKKHVIEKNYVKRYRSIIYVLFGVKGCARDLIEYLQFVSDSNYRVENDKDTKALFLTALTESGVTYSDSMINKAFEQLEDKNLLIRQNRGKYVINVDYIFRDSEKARLRLIEARLRFTPDGDTIEVSGSKREKDKVDVPLTAFNGHGTFRVGDKIKFGSDVFEICKVEKDKVCWFEGRKVIKKLKSEVFIHERVSI